METIRAPPACVTGRAPMAARALEVRLADAYAARLVWLRAGRQQTQQAAHTQPHSGICRAASVTPLGSLGARAPRPPRAPGAACWPLRALPHAPLPPLQPSGAKPLRCCSLQPPGPMHRLPTCSAVQSACYFGQYPAVIDHKESTEPGLSNFLAIPHESDTFTTMFSSMAN